MISEEEKSSYITAFSLHSAETNLFELTLSKLTTIYPDV
jgi:hypothetical protein